MNRLMRRLLLALLWLGMPVSAQTASQPNEGSRVTYDSTNNVFTLSWWGRSGKSYFIQHTDDFVTWGYYPVIIVGQDAVASMNFQTNAPRYFLRLEIEADPFNTDSDGDGIPDGWEVLHGLNPHFALDASATSAAGELTNLQKYQYGLDPTKLDSDGDGFSDLYEINHGTDPARPGPTVALIAPTWATLAN